MIIIRSAGLPARPEDADPFEGERAQDRLVALPGPFLLEVVRFGPSAVHDGGAGPFDERLAKESWGIPAPMDPDLTSAALSHRRDARVFLEIGGVRIPRSIRAKRDQQTRSKGRTRAGQ